MTSCIRGAVWRVVLEKEKKVYLIYEGHLLYVVAVNYEEEYKRKGYEVLKLNIQYEADSIVAEEILQYCKSQ